MFMNKYPYTDFHEMNLDWFLKKFNTIENLFNMRFYSTIKSTEEFAQIEAIRNTIISTISFHPDSLYGGARYVILEQGPENNINCFKTKNDLYAYLIDMPTVENCGGVPHSDITTVLQFLVDTYDNIEFLPHSYLCSGVNISNNHVHIEGHGATLTATGDNITLFTLHHPDCYINNLYLHGNNFSNTTGFLINKDSAEPITNNINISNTTLEDFTNGIMHASTVSDLASNIILENLDVAAVNGIDVSNISFLNIKNSIFNCTNSIKLSNVVNSMIKNNFIISSNISIHSVDSGNNIIQGNSLTSGLIGFSEDNTTQSDFYCTIISDNIFKNMSQALVFNNKYHPVIVSGNSIFNVTTTAEFNGSTNTRKSVFKNNSYDNKAIAWSDADNLLTDTAYDTQVNVNGNISTSETAINVTSNKYPVSNNIIALPAGSYLITCKIRLSTTPASAKIILRHNTTGTAFYDMPVIGQNSVEFATVVSSVYDIPLIFKAVAASATAIQSDSFVHITRLN